MKQIAYEWIKSADLDKSTILELRNKENLTPVVSFHAQQLIEKIFKAILEEKEIKIPKTHKLADLYKLLNVTIIGLDPNELDIIDRLDQLYIETRYPSDLGLMPYGSPTLKDVDQFIVLADRLYSEVLNYLNS